MLSQVFNPKVMVIVAGRNEGGAGAQPLRQLKPEHAAIKCKRAIEIGDLEMNMPDPRSRDDGRYAFGHELSICAGASAPIYVTVIRYARSETSPSGKSNSKVFSVMETIV